VVASMKLNYDIYNVIQKIILILCGVTIIAIVFTYNYKDLPFFKYVNPLSFYGSVLLLMITTVNKIKQDQNTIVSDKNTYIQKMFKLINGFNIFTVIFLFVFYLDFIKINDKFNDILGIASLGIALSTEIIAIWLSNRLLKDARRKFTSRYNDLHNPQKIYKSKQ
jgi:hypothetical protein